jgi:hypothetical protein
MKKPSVKPADPGILIHRERDSTAGFDISGSSMRHNGHKGFLKKKVGGEPIRVDRKNTGLTARVDSV